jgi:hypothetical protein
VHVGASRQRQELWLLTCSQLPLPGCRASPHAAAPSWAASSSIAARASCGRLAGGLASALPQTSSSACRAGRRASAALAGVALTGVAERGVPPGGVPAAGASSSSRIGSGMAEEKPLRGAGEQGQAHELWASADRSHRQAARAAARRLQLQWPLPAPPLLTSTQWQRCCWLPCLPAPSRSGSPSRRCFDPWPFAACWLRPRGPCVHQSRHPRQAACWAGSC